MPKSSPTDATSAIRAFCNVTTWELTSCQPINHLFTKRPTAQRPTSVPSAPTGSNARTTWRSTLKPFMNGQEPTPANFVTGGSDKNTTWQSTSQRFMKARSLTPAVCAPTNPPENPVCNGTCGQFTMWRRVARWPQRLVLKPPAVTRWYRKPSRLSLPRLSLKPLPILSWISSWQDWIKERATDLKHPVQVVVDPKPDPPKCTMLRLQLQTLVT